MKGQQCLFLYAIGVTVICILLIANLIVAVDAKRIAEIDAKNWKAMALDYAEANRVHLIPSKYMYDIDQMKAQVDMIPMDNDGSHYSTYGE